MPYKIMNKLGFMHGSKETAKGRAAEKKHKSDYSPSGLIKGLGGEHRSKKSKSKGPSFTEAMNR